MESILLPCPFCGTNPQVKDKGGGSLVIRCPSCWCKMSGAYEGEMAGTHRDPRVRWNTRFNPRQFESDLTEFEKKLAPCSKCGGQAKYFNDEPKLSRVYCSKCGFKVTGSIFKAGKDPVLKWNALTDNLEKSLTPKEVERINQLDEATEKRNK